MPAWEGLVTPEEIEVYKRAGYFKDVEWGKRPAVLVIDVEYNFTGEYPEPVLSAVEKYRNSCGMYAWESIPRIQHLLRVARSKNVPIAYTHGVPDPKPATEYEATRGTAIVAEIAPLAEDKVIAKEGTSAFFCTPLLSHLISLNVDTVLVTGCTTSGCVRATVIDAYDYRFKTIVVEDCVFDRAMTPHRINLFDMAAKYANVLSLSEVIRRLDKRP